MKNINVYYIDNDATIPFKDNWFLWTDEIVGGGQKYLKRKQIS
jgi:hypothetical protein